MKRIFQTRSAFAAASVFIVSGVQANSYTIVDLGDCDCRPAAISPGGVIVASRVTPPLRGQEYRGGRWHKFAPRTQLTAINRGGDVGGYFDGGVNDGKAAIWPRVGAPIHIDPPAGGRDARLQALDANSVAVGTYALDGHERCFIKTTGHDAEDLGLPAGATDCAAHSVTDVSAVGTAVMSNGRHRGFYKNFFTGLFHLIGVLPGADYSEARQHNRRGTIVGTSGWDSGGAHAIWWPGVLDDLDPEGRYYKSVALSISPDKGDFIVGHAMDCDGCDSIAVRFDVRSQPHVVVPLLSEVSNPGNWKSLSRATSVNGKGVIVGWGDNGVRSDEPFMLIPDAIEDVVDGEQGQRRSRSAGVSGIAHWRKRCCQARRRSSHARASPGRR